MVLSRSLGGAEEEGHAVTSSRAVLGQVPSLLVSLCLGHHLGSHYMVSYGCSFPIVFGNMVVLSDGGNLLMPPHSCTDEEWEPKLKPHKECLEKLGQSTETSHW